MKSVVRQVRKRSTALTGEGRNAPRPRGEVIVTVGELQRHFWKYMRLVSRKGWVVKILVRDRYKPQAVLMPYPLFQRWSEFLQPTKTKTAP